MVASRPALPPELLLVIFHCILQPIIHESKHLRASLALVSRAWRDLIYNTPSFWTTIHDVHLGQRNALAFVKSGNKPLDIVLNFSRENFKLFQDSYKQAVQHSHRWRTIQLTSYQFHELTYPAPLLESASIKVVTMPHSMNLFSGRAPRLRSLQLDCLAIPWNAGMLSGLHTLKLRFISQEGPTVLELLSILDASPDLSGLHLWGVTVAPHPLPIYHPAVDLSRLIELKVWGRGRDDPDIIYFLNHITSPHCQTLCIRCCLGPETGLDRLMESISSHIPPIICANTPTRLVIYSESIALSIHITEQHKCGLEFLSPLDWRAPLDVFSALISVLPQQILVHDTELALESNDSFEEALSILDAASGALHITAFRMMPYNGRMRGRIIERLGSPNPVFPSLRELRLDVSGLPPGVLAQVVKDRASHGHVPLAHLSVARPGPKHNEDREIIQSIIGPDRLLWGEETLTWVRLGLDEE